MELNFIESIIDFLSYEVNKTPTMYSWFHIMFLLIVIVITIICINRYKDSTIKDINRLLRTFAVIMLLFEIYKQLVFSVDGSVWDYQWYIFPFQFCSVPMYLMLIASFLKDGNIRRGILVFLATYNLFAGAAVMLYPSDVFTSTLGISIQTMVHHGLMVVIGITLLVNGQIPLVRKEIFKAALVFFILGFSAFLMNIAFHNVDGTFNMFFIGPYYDTHLPVLSTIESTLGYIPFLISYFVGFSLIAYLILLIAIFFKNKKFNIHKNERLNLNK